MVNSVVIGQAVRFIWGVWGIENANRERKRVIKGKEEGWLVTC